MNVLIFGSADGVMDRAAKSLLEVFRSRPDGTASVALSGGSTPEGLYRLLAARYADRVPWDRLEVFFGDERCVSPDARDSNYRMARESLLDRVPIPIDRVHRLRGDADDLDEAARDYERTIRERVPPGPGGLPALDLIWLGLGADGHTASLFPGTPALSEEARLVVRNPVASLGTSRMTFTPPLIRAARAVQFLVTGEAKADIVASIVGPEATAEAAEAYPAGRVALQSDNVEWLLDRAAARRIQDPGWIA